MTGQRPTWDAIRREIAEQADVVAATLAGAQQPATRVLQLAASRELNRIVVVGAGASLHAAQAMRWWVEDLTGLVCEPVESLEYLAYAYRRDTPRTLVVVISASGRESLTLDALRRALAGPALVVGLTDAGASPFATDTHAAFITHSTKLTGWPTQTTAVAMAVLAALALHLAPAASSAAHIARPQLDALVPQLAAVVAASENPMRELACRLAAHKVFGFVGAGPAWGVANDGVMLVTMATGDLAVAWETEEVHHGGHAAALIAAGDPIFILAPAGPGRQRALETVDLIHAASGQALVLSTTDSPLPPSTWAYHLPDAPDYLSPFLYLPVLHWFAYYLARFRVERGEGRDGMLIRGLAAAPSAAGSGSDPAAAPAAHRST